MNSECHHNSTSKHNCHGVQIPDKAIALINKDICNEIPNTIVVPSKADDDMSYHCKTYNYNLMIAYKAKNLDNNDQNAAFRDHEFWMRLA